MAVTKTTVTPGPKSYTASQWATLLALSDGLVGPLSPSLTASILSTLSPSDPRYASASTFLNSLPSATPLYCSFLAEVIDNRLPPGAVTELATFLSLVSNPVGAVLLCGTATPITKLPREKVEAVFKKWHGSSIAQVRTGAKALSQIIRFIWMRTCPGLVEATGYPGPPGPPEPKEVKVNGDSAGETTETAQPTPEPTAPSTTSIPTHPFLDAPEEKHGRETVRAVSTSVLVIGSGSGGSSFTSSLVRQLSSNPSWRTALPPLSPNGKRLSDILVVEKGTKYAPHPDAPALGSTEHDALDDLMENGCALTTIESSISIVAGSTWGGGSRVNWSGCLHLDKPVKEEWTRQMMGTAGRKVADDPHGKMFLGQEWQDCQDVIDRQLRLQMPQEADHNAANRVLLDGARALGYASSPVLNNLAGSFADHARCGANCCLGCRGHSAVDDNLGKMSGCRAFLAPLIPETKGEGEEGVSVAGVDGFEVDKIVFDEKEPKKAVGALGWVTKGKGRERVRVLIRANIVVLSAGSLHSPAVLLRSGVQNPNIGKNLHLHPTFIVLSRWKDEIRPWEGTILTSMVSEFSNLDGQGYGVNIEAMCMIPAFGMVWLRWGSNEEWKRRLLSFNRTMAHFTLCRDRATGSVSIDPSTGKPRLSYVPLPKDRDHIMQGVVGIAKMLYTAGAEEISTNVSGAPVWTRPTSSSKASASSSASSTPPTPASADSATATTPPVAEFDAAWSRDKSFLSFLEETQRVGNGLDRANFGSAHQMGTCRMGLDPKSAVVDARGKVYGHEGLYVADASVFPSASGVNPMLTIMTLGEWIGRRVAEDVLAKVSP